MKLKVYEYLVLLHPEVDKDGDEVGKTSILKDVTRVLAKDDKQVGMLAAREIPSDYLEQLERVEIIVRPF